MLATVLWSTAAIAAAGLLIKYLLDRRGGAEEITWTEFAIGMAAATFVISPLVGWAGYKVAQSNLLAFTEYWNGWELAAVRQDVPCTRDGPCRYTYDCDPYLVPVTYSCNCNDKGGCETCVRLETRYHSCPYVTVESTFTVRTTLGDYTIAEHRLPEQPQAHRWRRATAVPAGVIGRAGVGAPPFWREAKLRIDGGIPGPASIRKDYENYILASDRTILKQHSSAIERFRQAGLLPPVATNIRDFYLSDKVYFVGYRPPDAAAWQSALRYLNAALGTELQGDLHLVLVQEPRVGENPEAYALALRAHWQDRTILGKNCLSKNGIAVIAGTIDGTSVAWAHAFTGMPIGNEALTVAVRNGLKGTPFTPENIIGTVRGQFHISAGAKRVRGLHGQGALERILWGLEEPTTKFARVSMKAADAGDIGSGYLYLRGEIEPTTGQRITITVIEFVASLGVWLAAAAYGERRRRSLMAAEQRDRIHILRN